MNQSLETKVRFLAKMGRASEIPKDELIKKLQAHAIPMDMVSKVVNEVYASYTEQQASDHVSSVIDSLNPDMDSEGSLKVFDALGEPCC